MIYVSTNMYHTRDLQKVFSIVEAVSDIGIELFPLFHDPEFEKELQHLMPDFLKYPLTFHEPYYETDHAAPHGSSAEAETERQMRLAFSYAKSMRPKYMVFHYNNSRIGNAQKMKKIARENLQRYRQTSPAPILIENTGVAVLNNVLFSEEEFIAEAKQTGGGVLMDVGHANANGWDIEKLVGELSDSIQSYHLHSNDGIHDSHHRIFQNTPDYHHLIPIFQEKTPGADLVIEYQRGYSGREKEVVEDILRLRELWG